MQKNKRYYWTKFSPEVIRNATNQFKEKIPDDQRKLIIKNFTVDKEVEEWDFDNEDEYFADYRSDFNYSKYEYHLKGGIIKLNVYLDVPEPFSAVSVQLPVRTDIESVFSIFEDAIMKCQIPKPLEPPEEHWKSKVKIFIGHGHNPLWKDLKDHLIDKHNFKVEAYEIGARAGLKISDVLEEMLTQTSIAFLIYTGEVEDTTGNIHPRDNVIHETGLFQGRLGFNRAIILLERGIYEFSNIHGIQYLPFSKDSFPEIYGDVLATISREFEPEAK